MLTVPRIGSYPLMMDGTLDYTEGNEYMTERTGGTQEGLSIYIEHRVTGSNLIAELLLDGRATFVCSVVAAFCAYREVFVADQPLQRANGAIVQRQEIICDGDQVNHPVIFQPHVVTKKGIPPFKAEPRHGLEDFWSGESVEFPPAAIIAVGPFWNPLDGMRSMLRLKKDTLQRLPDGCFEVDESSENGFYFRVLVAPDLYDSLRDPEAAPQHRDSIYAAAFVQGLQILQKEYATEWKGHANLRALYRKLQERNIPTWDKDNFNANHAVAIFHPHKLTKIR